MSKRTASLPLEPLWEFARMKSEDPTFSIQDFADMAGTTDRAVSRWRSNGHRVPYLSADRAACKVGIAPVFLWGDEWLDAMGDYDKLAAEAIAEMYAEEDAPEAPAAPAPVAPAPVAFDGDNPEHRIAALTADLNTVEALIAMTGTPEVAR